MQKFNEFKKSVLEVIQHLSADFLGWLAVLLLHAATLPGLMAVMSGLTDQLPPIDLVLMVWSALALLFVRAAVIKDMLNIITIGFGFMIQAGMVALIFFR
jgi:hypothetical protein